jgi:NDP-sugar pyrophosphorylase family protein
MSEKIVILAAGSSTRMSKSLGTAVTERMTKCMIPLGKDETPFLGYLLTNLEQAGFREVVIVTAEGDFTIQRYFGDTFGTLAISTVVQTVPAGRTKPAGTADALLQALRTLPEWADESFCVCNSDNLYSVSTLKKLRNSSYHNALPCYDRKGLEYTEDRTARFAVIDVSEDFSVQGIIEKPTDMQIAKSLRNGTVFVSMNLFKLDYAMALETLDKVPYSADRNEKDLPSAIGLMILEQPGCMHGFVVCEHVPDLTSATDILTVSGEIATG